jgi:alkanesulfonate monooxygenase SsuD/methylene tetrahydromethanopterin reductase-like flavin-dependent oxidoreductase (luciferase family)
MPRKHDQSLAETRLRFARRARSDPASAAAFAARDGDAMAQRPGSSECGACGAGSGRAASLARSNSWKAAAAGDSRLPRSDPMEEWFEGRGCDGFVLVASQYPASFEDFTWLVVPELQRRGLYHRDYAGATLRENLGLARPGTGAWKDAR